MQLIELRTPRYDEMQDSVTLESVIKAVIESIEPGEEAIVPHVVSHLLQSGKANITHGQMTV